MDYLGCADTDRIVRTLSTGATSPEWNGLRLPGEGGPELGRRRVHKRASILDVDRDLFQRGPVLAAVVPAEEQLAAATEHSQDTGRGATPVTAVGGVQQAAGGGNERGGHGVLPDV